MSISVFFFYTALNTNALIGEMQVLQTIFKSVPHYILNIEKSGVLSTVNYFLDLHSYV